MKTPALDTKNIETAAADTDDGSNQKPTSAELLAEGSESLFQELEISSLIDGSALKTVAQVRSMAFYLVEKKVCDSERMAQRFIEWLQASAAGEQLAPEIRNYLDAQLVAISQLNDMSNLRQAAIEVQQERERLESRVAKLTDDLQLEEYFYGEIVKNRDFFARGHAPGQKDTSAQIIMNFYGEGLAATAAAKHMETKTLPALKTDLAAAKAARSVFAARGGSRPSPGETGA